MKYLKLLAITASLALAVVSSASAKTIHLEVCEKGSTLCLTASKGAIVLAHGKNVILKNAFLFNSCEADLETEVVSSLSSSDEEKIDSHLISVNFLNCTKFTVDALNLPWLFLTWLSLFSASKTGLAEGGVLVDLLKTPVGTCSYVETSKDMPTFKWEIGSPTKVSMAGSLEREAGSNALCGLGSLEGTFTTTGVHDKMYSELHSGILPGNVIINELA